uniref:Signal recognition particle receptor subunit beta n=1 Tax=Meloidogyne javanica TaxID=6303 RepID=A0A915MUP4_MELJA
MNEGLDKPFILVDYPGAETLRKALFNKWFNEQINSVCCVIFVVDSATFSKKDVAEYLYDVLYETKNTKIPVLVVCNKQDLAHAKAGQTGSTQKVNTLVVADPRPQIFERIKSIRAD